jgi:hypothetical protein
LVLKINSLIKLGSDNFIDFWNQNKDEIESQLGKLLITSPKNLTEIEIFLVNTIPCEHFDPIFYLNKYPDVYGSGDNPFAHYFKFGGKELREVSDRFDVEWFIARYFDPDKIPALPILEYAQNIERYKDSTYDINTSPVNREELITVHRNSHFNFEDYKLQLLKFKIPFENCSSAYHFLKYQDEMRWPSPLKAWDISYSRHIENLKIHQYIGNSISKFSDLNIQSVGYDSNLLAKNLKKFNETNEWLLAFETDVVKKLTTITTKFAIHNGLINKCRGGYILPASVVGGISGVMSGPYFVSDEIYKTYSDFSIQPKTQGIAALGSHNYSIYLKLKATQTRNNTFAVNLIRAGSSNYFHFVFEVLWDFIQFTNANGYDNQLLYLDEGVHKNYIDLLECYVDKPVNYQKVEKGKVASANRLWISQKSNSTTFPSVTSPKVTTLNFDISTISIEQIRNQNKYYIELRNQLHQNPKVRKIYLLRSSNYRVIVNENELISALVDLNFEIVACDKLTIQQQIKIFYESKYIVTSTGASMTNLLWCTPGTRVVCLMPDHENIPQSYWPELSKNQDITYSELRCSRLYKINNKHDYHDDFYVNVKDLLKII